MTGNQAGGYVSALASFGSAFSNSNAESSSAQFKANQLNLDSQVSALQAESTIGAGEEQSEMVGKKVAGVVGSERASFASQGVVVDTGSASETQSSSYQQGALEEQTIRNNAWREAWGLKVQSANEASEAQMVALEGKSESFNTLMTGGLKAVGDIESGYLRSDKES